MAKALLDSFPDMQVKIRPHIRVKGHKNPELEIDGLIADNKKIEKWKGISNGISTALNRQGCKVVVIDLDAHIKTLNLNEVSKYIAWREQDFNEQRLKRCFVVFEGRAIETDRAMSKSEIKEVLKQLKPKSKD